MNQDKIDCNLLRNIVNGNEGDQIVILTIKRPLTEDEIKDGNELGLKHLKNDSRKLLVAKLNCEQVKCISARDWCIYIEAEKEISPPANLIH